jgi:protein-S-isoprenylcysteine O-methyltransferase Ste14
MGFLWLFLLILVWGFFHSVLASLQFKYYLKRIFGRRVDRIYRLTYNLFAGISLMAVLVVAAFLPDKKLYSVPFPWLALMVVGELLAGMALVIGFSQSRPFEFLGMHQLESLNDEPPRLTTSGLYHYVRHPLYSAGLVMLWLIPRMTVNLLVMNLAFTIYIIIGATLEEQKLTSELGQEYRDYMKVTPMFIPFLKRNISQRGTS